MSFLYNWLSGNGASVPALISTDTVIPLHSHDDNTVFRSIAMRFSMRFDDKLDVDKLVGALERLIEKPGWRKLGGRLRLDAKTNKLFYHVPKEFSKDRPAIRFTHATYDVPVASHPEGSKVPRANNNFTLTPPSGEFDQVCFGPNQPTKMTDWIYDDRPQLQLHIASFQDATIVTLTWLHTLFDALGRNALLRAWTMMLDGREDQVPEVYGYDFDPLATLGSPESEKLEEKPEKSVLEGRELSTWQLIRFGVSLMWDFFVYRKEDQRGVCLPPSFFAKLREEAIHDLASAPPDTVTMDTRDPANPRPFLSDGDILGAWWMRIIITSQPWLSSAPPTKTINFMNIFGMRELLTTTEPKLLPRGAAYVSNAANCIHSFLTLKEVLELPLGHLAARIRKDLVTQGTRAQISAAERLARQTFEGKGRHPLYGSGDMVMMNFSNWTKGRMYETDFSAAVVEEGSVKHERGKPTYIHANGVSESYPLRNSGCVPGRDLAGNYWIGACAREKVFEGIQRALRSEAERV